MVKVNVKYLGRSFVMLREAARVIAAVDGEDQLHLGFVKYLIRTQDQVEILVILNDCFIEALVRK